MKLANYERDGLIRAGIVKGDRIYDIAEAAESAGVPRLKAVSSVDQVLDDSLIEALRKAEAKLTAGKGKPLSSVKLKSPVMFPEKIFMVAVN